MRKIILIIILLFCGIDILFAWMMGNDFQTGNQDIHGSLVGTIEDTHDSSGFPTTTYGVDTTENEIGYEPDVIKRAYFKVTNLDKIPSAAIIKSAILKVYCVNSRYDVACRVHRCTESWSASTLNWNNKPAYTTDNVASPTVSDGAFIEANITDIVQWMVANKTNYGFVMKQNDEAIQGSWDIHFIDSTTVAYRPTFAVSW